MFKQFNLPIMQVENLLANYKEDIINIKYLNFYRQ